MIGRMELNRFIEDVNWTIFSRPRYYESIKANHFIPNHIVISDLKLNNLL